MSKVLTKLQNDADEMCMGYVLLEFDFLSVYNVLLQLMKD